MTGDARGLRVETRPGVVEVTFDRPERRNALTLDCYRLLPDILGRVAEDPSVRAVVLRGAGGRAFSAGTDAAELATIRTGADGVAYEALVGGAVRAVRECEAVTVAAVDGVCAGGGLALAAQCDLRVATETARFGYPIARTMANLLATDVLERSVAVFGDPLVREMVLLSRFVDARRAYAVGAVTDVVPHADLDTAVAAVVDSLTTAAPGTTWATKRQLRGGSADAEEERVLVARIYASDDFRRGVAAFAARATPDFGRARWPPADREDRV